VTRTGEDLRLAGGGFGLQLRQWTGFLATLCLIGVLACSDEPSEPADPSQTQVITAAPIPQRSPTELQLPIKVAVTLPLFVEFAQLAGPGNAEVISLIPAGLDPHTYEFTAADIERMEGIDLFFFNGLGLDSRLQGAIEANRDETAYVIPFAPNIKSPQGNNLTAEQAGDNSHLWLDPSLAYVYTEIVADEFIIYDGIRRDFYTTSWTAFRDRMLAFQAELTGELETIPAERRRLVTLHDSFAHFARRFDFTVAGHASDAPAQINETDIQRLAQLVRDQLVPAVFTEFGYDSSGMEEVARRAGVPLCTLYSDILVGDVSTYEEMMRANVRELVRCLAP
jgi:ABC-type Zn uptake system ZnuABC Zn-binding protein ZnuA